MTGCLNDVISDLTARLNDTNTRNSGRSKGSSLQVPVLVLYSYIFLERNLFVGYYDYTRVPTIGFLLGFVISHMHSWSGLADNSVNLRGRWVSRRGPAFLN